MKSDNQQQDRFYELLKPELPRLQAFSQRLMGDQGQGDDLAQDALYDAWKGFGRLREIAAFKPWLYRILLNRYRTNLRQFKNRSNRTVSLADDIVDDSQTRMRNARDRLSIAMNHLSDGDRALVTLHELEGWSYSELAVKFGCGEAALRTRLTRSRQKMREALLRFYERTDKCSLTMKAANPCAAGKQEQN